MVADGAGVAEGVRASVGGGCVGGSVGAREAVAVISGTGAGTSARAQASAAAARIEDARRIGAPGLARDFRPRSPPSAHAAGF
jgi:hypothetical protein